MAYTSRLRALREPSRHHGDFVLLRLDDVLGELADLGSLLKATTILAMSMAPW
ncbi:hypothetical protein [Microvirga sp. G4-2]|uniref:hypothetical protein n=1 Tax=Microvirga sp. G4-2 TaxID=3434467 RepID=UPI00404403D8